MESQPVSEEMEFPQEGPELHGEALPGGFESGRGFQGGFPKAPTFDPKKDHVDDLELPGQPLITEVFYRKEAGIFVLSDQEKQGHVRHYASWKYPSVSLWKKVKKYKNAFEQEEHIWRVCLLETSLLDKHTFDKGSLSKESHKKILNFSPSLIPQALVHKYIKKTILSHSEMVRIERECMRLWGTENGSIRNPHPILEDVIHAMSLYENFGIQTWKNIDDIHVKVFEVIRKTLECYAISTKLRVKESELRQRAAQQAGLRRK